MKELLFIMKTKRKRVQLSTVSSNFKMGPEKQTYYLTLRETEVVNVLNINCAHKTNLKSTCKFKSKLPYTGLNT